MASKKENEEKVLEEALVKARARGGRSKKNVDRIRGLPVERKKAEAPDFVFERKLKRVKDQAELICIEHFRVDQFCEGNEKKGHMDSLAVPEEKKTFAMWEEWKEWRESGHRDEIPASFLEELGNCIGARFAAYEKASYFNYIKSFQRAFCAHCGKVDAYRRNVEELYGQTRKIRMVFLIELHSDYSECGFNAGQRSGKPFPGELILFWDMVHFLREAKGVDYFIIASCPAWSSNVVDAVVLRASALKQDMIKQKIAIARYYGEDRRLPATINCSVAVDMSEGEEAANYVVEEKGRGLSLETKISLCLECLPSAAADWRKGTPFVCSMLMQALVDLCFDCDFGQYSHPAVVAEKVSKHLLLMGSDEENRRLQFIEQKWFEAEAK